MKNKKLKEILTVMNIAIFAAACDCRVVAFILVVVTIAIVYSTPWDGQ